MAGEHPPWLDGLSLLSHDLRRPLTVIRGAATLLLEAQDQLPAASRSQILGLIDESVEAMSELIEDLSVVSRLAAGTLEVSLQSVPVDDLVSAAVEASRRVSSGAKVAAVAAPGLEVEVDRALATRALRALLVAALQRAREPALGLQVEPEDGAVRLVVRVPAGKGGEARGEASFEALRPAGPDPGLALYMARGAARAMGGDVTVTSDAGGDLVLSFTLNRRA
jgi:K+-sensing histidine kinase KdpD